MGTDSLGLLAPQTAGSSLFLSTSLGQVSDPCPAQLRLWRAWVLLSLRL